MRLFYINSLFFKVVSMYIYVEYIKIYIFYIKNLNLSLDNNKKYEGNALFTLF